MDHFGIGAAVQGLFRVYQQTARRSGRTTSLIESVKSGDRIVFADAKEADRVERLLRDRRVDVDCIVVDTKTPWVILERGSLPGDGRTIFDHGWVEQFYTETIEHAGKMISRWQRETSGYGEAHRETRRRAEEIARWKQL